ncbi:possible outer membrane protein OprF [Stappia aggregata IAM 12614]|uniref:Possible outer membrane protein OprF n=1 Tax=Roseibium aggregatum (strain ATCC 25650 / DSM 13394 / JCM 20685 / NBRC 16684 / NCIMB 2208 / IAM 12614 / B1) TaxID=384765 RepID=A0NYL8_ROSAI|nr:OmpA family protein [Roseibium aggregatum]EAV42214.1 possible outer membrane protein OprF [Stappia aggregata IAM 12614] [Roseibium aggregatum IAM 12614]
MRFLAEFATARLTLATVLALMVGLMLPVGVSAQTVTPDQIIKALLPDGGAPKSRSMRKQEPHPFRGISIEGQLPPEVVLPRINLTVNFEFDSASLTNDGILTLQALGQALQDPRLKNMRFQIAGHTDLRGTADYNLDLSKRRAFMVAEFLAAFYTIPRGQLVPVGYGESRPVDPGNPSSGRNRRVEIINVQPLS